MKNNFILIGLVQNEKTAENDWTYSCDDDELREVSEDAVTSSRSMSDHLVKYGFAIYDTSTEREQVLDQIVEDIKSKLV